MAQYLDKNGLSHLITLIKNAFVAKVEGKGLSTNDYSTADKTKLDGIAEGANNYVLPKATTGALGGVIVGDGLTVSEAGVLTANAQEGTKDYTQLSNLPQVNGVTLTGNKTTSDLGIHETVLTKATGDAYITRVDNIPIAAKFDVNGNNITSTYLTSASISGKEDVSNKVATVSADSTTTQYASAKAVWDAVEGVVEVAQGKTASYVFATVEALDAELAKESFKKDLHTGDVFLIEAIDVSDYWWTGTAKAPLETTKVDISRITEQEITDLFTA